MTRDPHPALPRLPGAPVLAAALLLLLGASAASAQNECLGFERRDVITGGTNGVESVHIADLDGDGDRDVLSASFGDGSVYWFENDWDANDPPDRTPTFKAHLINGSLDNASSVYTADLDGDDLLDVIGASRDDDAVFWFEQAAGISPIFSARAVTLDSTLPLSVFAADVDGDQDIDVLSASFLDNTIAWYENVGGTPPSFTKHVIATDAIGAASVFAIDYDGDGDIDVFSASRLDDRIVWYEQDGVDAETGEPLFEPHDVTTSALGATSVYAADVDGDGDIDVLSASHADNTIAWYEEIGADADTGEIIFMPHVISTSALDARTVVVGFVNDDPYLDVLSASRGDDKIAWYRSDGATPPNFTEVVITTDATHADDVRVGDLDNDGDLDVVSASSVPGFPASQDKIRWYEQDGVDPDTQEVLFTPHDIYFSADGAVSAVAADLDDDGDEDVATAGRTNRIAWYESDGASIPAFDERIISLDALGASDISAADLNGDGDIDLVSASADDDKIAWYENDGAADPTFVENVITTDARNAWDVYVADLDGDMKLDVISAANVAPDPVEPPGDPVPVDNIVWYRNDGGSPPTFEKFVISQNAPGARSVFAIDVDGDLDIDVISASFDDNKIAWYENVPGPNAGDPPDFGTEHVVTETARGATSVFAADIDGDLDVDFLTTESLTSAVAWYEQDPEPDPDTGALTYTRHVIASDANEVSSAIAEDLDGDGDMDVVAAVPGDRVIGWFENLGGTPPVWGTHLVTLDADDSLRVAIGDLNQDGKPDIVSGSRLSVFWYAGSGEICDLFDADGDGLIDGNELAWIGRAFGLLSADPASEWWAGVDYNQDGMIDGDDLAILSSPGVFGFTTDTCVYICR